jgi:hypothetical protein
MKRIRIWLVMAGISALAGCTSLNQVGSRVVPYYAEDFQAKEVNAIPAEWVIVFDGQGRSAQGIREEGGNRYLRVPGRSSWSCAIRREFPAPMPPRVTYSLRVRTLAGNNAVNIGNGARAVGVLLRDLGIRDSAWHGLVLEVDFNADTAVAILDGQVVRRDIELGVQEAKGEWSS